LLLLLLLLLFCFVILGFDPSETDNNLKINKTYNNVEEDYDRKNLYFIHYNIYIYFPAPLFLFKNDYENSSFFIGDYT